MQGFLCQSTKFTKKCAKIKLEHYKFQQAITLQILVRFKMFWNQNGEISAYEVSWILLTVRYIALDRLTWNDPRTRVGCKRYKWSIAYAFFERFESYGVLFQA